jgi:hypothetical protein
MDGTYGYNQEYWYFAKFRTNCPNTCKLQLDFRIQIWNLSISNFIDNWWNRRFSTILTFNYDRIIICYEDWTLRKSYMSCTFILFCWMVIVGQNKKHSVNKSQFGALLSKDFIMFSSHSLTFTCPFIWPFYESNLWKRNKKP